MEIYQVRFYNNKSLVAHVELSASSSTEATNEAKTIALNNEVKFDKAIAINITY